MKIVERMLDAYESVKFNLDRHAPGYPLVKTLRQCVHLGIGVFGESLGDGFGEEKYNSNPGVQCILNALEKEDSRPLWVASGAGQIPSPRRCVKSAGQRTARKRSGFFPGCAFTPFPIRTTAQSRSGKILAVTSFILSRPQTAPPREQRNIAAPCGRAFQRTQTDTAVRMEFMAAAFRANCPETMLPAPR